jgi:hypothetical protein
MVKISKGNWTIKDFDDYCAKYNIKHKLEYFPNTSLNILRENVVDVDIFRSMQLLTDFPLELEELRTLLPKKLALHKKYGHPDKRALEYKHSFTDW